MSPIGTGEPSLEDLEKKGFKLSDGSGQSAPDDKGKTKDTPPEDKSGRDAGKYDGKSDEDLRAILSEQEKKLGEMATRIDKFKGDADYWRNKADAIDRERQIYAERYVSTVNRPKDNPEEPKFNWERPVDTIDERVDRKLTDFERKQAQYRMYEVQENAKAAFQDGFKRAVRENPKLFEGEDFQGEVVDFMYNYYKPFAERGMPVDKYVGNPDVWKKTAQMKRLEKEEFDALQPEKIEPVGHTPTNAPGGRRLVGAEDEPVDFERGAHDMIDWFKQRGYVEGEEEAAELVREERRERAEMEK